ATLTLAGGRRIMLERLVQSLTYQGLLMGLPGEAVNRSVMARMLDHARDVMGAEPQPVLIEPVMEPFTARRQGRRLSREGLGDFEGEVEEVADYRLPLVTCIASFRCPQTIAPVDALALFSYSIATVVWLQDT